MSYENYGGGLYGQTSGSGAPIGLNPATLRAEIVDPVIRALLAGTSAPPDQSTTQGLLNWAGSQGRSSRAIMPTIPGLTLPASIRQILQQPSLAQIAKGLGGPTVDPNAPVNTGQFPSAPTSGGQLAPAPTSGTAAPAPAGTAPATDFVTQIVNQAVQQVLSEGGATGKSSGSTDLAARGGPSPSGGQTGVDTGGAPSTDQHPGGGLGGPNVT